MISDEGRTVNARLPTIANTMRGTDSDASANAKPRWTKINQYTNGQGIQNALKSS